MHAYDEQYLDDAMKCLGEAMDYAVNSCNIKMDDFLDLFIATGIARQFAVGSPKYISSLSGTELTMRILTFSNVDIDFPNPQIEYEYSKEYWCGWILAYYQWYTGRTFKDIKKYVSMEEIEKLYFTLHEADETKFVNTINHKINCQIRTTRLQTQRKICGYSQRELANKVGMSLRTLQQYEIKAKDINKAAGITLLAISRVLGCQIEDILEYDTSDV